MRHLLTALAFIAVSATAAQAEICLVQVSGVIHLEGNCLFQPQGGGDFRMLSPDQRIIVDFTLDTSSRGFAVWNDYQGAVDTSLGHLSRTGACWSNPTATICAWK